MSDGIAGLAERVADETLPKVERQAVLAEIRAYGEQLERDLRQLRDHKTVLLSIMNLIPVAFFVKDHKSRFFLVNRACEEQWGVSFADLHGTDGSQVFPKEQMAQFLAMDRFIFDSRKPMEFEETFWSVAQQGNRIGYTFKLPMYDDAGDPQYLVCVTIDITERKLAQAALLENEQKLLSLATTDFLTDLPNRRYFMNRLSDEFDRMQRLDGAHCSVLMLDLDHFKAVNDTHGHAGGDAVLKHFAGLLRKTLRRIDIAGRIGGEEFAVILPGTGSAAARRSAERVRAAVAESPTMHDGIAIPVTVSIGLATIDARDASGDEVLTRADAAMYRAKENGRDRVELAE